MKGIFKEIHVLRVVLLLSVMCFAGCEEKQEGPGGLARMELGKYSVSFDTYEKSSVTFSLLSTRDWSATCTAGWVALSQEEGKASSEKTDITVYVTRNDGTEREAEVIFVNGRYTKVLRIVQAGRKAIQYTSLADVRSYCDSGQPLPSGTVIKATVTSDRMLNNLISYKIAYVQDETAGLKFYFSSQHTLDMGDVVTMDLSGYLVSSYEGSVQIEGVPYASAKVIKKGEVVLPERVSVEDLMANRCDGKYVSVDNVSVSAEYKEAVWASRGAHTLIGIDTGGTGIFYVMTSKYAESLYNVNVPQGSGTLCGIASTGDEEGSRQIRIFFTKTTDYQDLK